MFVYEYSNSCSFIFGNDSLSDDQKLYRLQEWYLMTAILPLSIIAGLVNGISLLVFSRQVFDNAAVHFNLMAISLVEVVLQCVVVCEAIFIVSGIERFHYKGPCLTTTIIHVLLNAMFSIRNWSVVLISVSRCEVVLRPLSLLLISFGFSIVRALKYKGVICLNKSKRLALKNLLGQYDFYANIEVYGMFLFQSCIPVALIILATGIIWYKLQQSRKLFSTNKPTHTKLIEKKPKAPKDNNVNMELSMTAANRRGMISNKSRNNTTQLVMILSFVFGLLLLPTFIITCVTMRNKRRRYIIHPDLFSNGLQVIGSVLNVFVYAASSKRFRMNLVTMIRPTDNTYHSRSYLL